MKYEVVYIVLLFEERTKWSASIYSIYSMYSYISYRRLTSMSGERVHKQFVYSYIYNIVYIVYIDT